MWKRLSIVIVAMLVLAACSGNDSSPSEGPGTGTQTGTGTGTGGGPANGVVTVTIAGFAFEPSVVTLTEGDSLTVRNEDTTTHTFTMDDGSIDETLDPGDQVVVTPTVEGGFHCNIHPSMTGMLEFG